MKFEYIIATYKNAELLEKCIQSIYLYTPKASIIVCDDASPSIDVMEILDVCKRHKVKLKTSFWNQGFGCTCNRGIEGSNADIAILVNQDIEFTMNIEKELTKIFMSDEWIGVVGALLYYPDGTIQYGGHAFISQNHDLYHYDHGKNSQEAKMAYINRFNISVTGALMAIRKEMINHIGGFKKDYWLAYEDNEFCFRAWHNGWKVFYTKDISAIHHEGKIRGANNIQKRQLGTLQKEQQTRQTYYADIRNYDFEEIQRLVKKANGLPVPPRVYRVGFIRGGALGDVIMTTGIIEEFKRRNPDVDIYVGTYCPEPFLNNSNVKKIFRDFNQVIEQCDEVYNLDMVYENNPTIPVVQAYADCVFKPKQYYMEKVFPVIHMDIQSRQNIQEKVLPKFHNKNKIAVLHMARGFWTMKHLPENKWEETITRLKDAGYYVVSIGKGNDYVSKNVDLSLRDLPFNEALELIKMADVFIGIDGGMAHLAMTTETPCVLIFSVADPECFVFRTKDTKVIEPHSECKYCRNKYIGVTGVMCKEGDNQCINSIEVDDIIKAVEELQ